LPSSDTTGSAGFSASRDGPRTDGRRDPSLRAPRRPRGRLPGLWRAWSHVLNAARRTRLSKFCSGALRHFPEDAGLELDGAGWTEWTALVAAVQRKYDWATERHLAAVVATDPKGRFERTDEGGEGDAERIRAAYGHSVAVDIDAEPTPVPDTLYHGTAPRNVDSIREAGLQPMDRQQVHLSADVETAREVGARHADEPVVFAVDAAAMRADGRTITKRGAATYTTDAAPPEYLSLLE